MYLQYIEDNLNKIIENPDSVLYLKPYDVGRKRALFAIVKKEPGVYQKLQLTKEQSKMNFPFEPIRWFYQGPGYFYLKDFIVLNYNWMALNTTNLEGFKHKVLEDNKKQVGIFATFNDGSAAFICRENAKKFEKQNGIDAYLDLLKKYKDFEPHYDIYKDIEYYIKYYTKDNNTFIISDLQQIKEEQPNNILFQFYPFLHQ